MTKTRLKHAATLIPRLALGAGLLLLPLYAWKVHLKVDYTDFDVYYRAGTRANHEAWSEIYTLADGASPYRYAPLFLPFFGWLARLPHEAAKLLWYFLQFGALVLSYELLTRMARLLPTLRRNHFERAAAALALFAVLRFWLDCFMIGQVSSLIFVCFSLALLSWTLGQPLGIAAGLFLPTTFKLGPGILLGLIPLQRPNRVRSSSAWLLVMGGFTFLVSALWVGSLSTNRYLWTQWSEIVRGDSAYYDASHYGSQSIKSALLRMAKNGIISAAAADQLYLSALLLGSAFVLLFWIFRRPRGFLGRGLFFSLGIFAYVWFMPETFKYTLTALALPLLVLQAAVFHPGTSAKDRLGIYFAFVLGALFLTFAGKDLMSDDLFFGLQKASLPLISTLALGLVTLRLACLFSGPSPFLLALRSVFVARRPGPWPVLPLKHGDLDSSFLLPLPLGLGRTFDPSLMKELLLEASSQFCEVIVCSFGTFSPDEHPESLRLKSVLPASIRWIPCPGVDQTRSAALRHAFLKTHGRILFVGHAEQPVELEFFVQAALLLSHAAGPGLVRANRRHKDSQFEVPVSLLRLVYRRHRLGLLFNRLVRAVLPISTTDTHSGSFGMTRAFALQAFATQSSLGFLFDLELSLVARAQAFQEAELPARIQLSIEKQPRRILAEMLSILMGLPGLALRNQKKLYTAPGSFKPEGISADDWGLSPGVNEGILALVKLGLVRRVSLMANTTSLTHRLPELLAEQRLDPRIKLGLHFNLTYGDRQRFGHSSPARFILRSLGHTLNPFSSTPLWWNQVREELALQLAALKKVGVSAQFFDGHQHVHLVPGMIHQIAAVLKDAGISQVRLPYDPALWLTPRMPISALALLAVGSLKRHQFESLACFYPLPGQFADPSLLRAKLAYFSKSEVILHPAAFNDIDRLEFPDPLAEARVTEFHAIRMAGFSL